MAAEVEVQKRAARRLGGDEFARALFDLGRASQPHAEARNRWKWGPAVRLAALTIGQVAERAGLNTSHLRFYERSGVLPQPERVSGQRRYHVEVLHRLSIIDVAQRAGLTLEEIAPLTGPENRSADAGRHIRALADEKLPHIDALIARDRAVKHWLQVAQSCDCSSVDVCGCSSIRHCCRPPVRSSSTSGRSARADTADQGT